MYYTFFAQMEVMVQCKSVDIDDHTVMLIAAKHPACRPARAGPRYPFRGRPSGRGFGYGLLKKSQAMLDSFLVAPSRIELLSKV